MKFRCRQIDQKRSHGNDRHCDVAVFPEQPEERSGGFSRIPAGLPLIRPPFFLLTDAEWIIGVHPHAVQIHILPVQPGQVFPLFRRQFPLFFCFGRTAPCPMNKNGSQRLPYQSVSVRPG